MNSLLKLKSDYHKGKIAKTDYIAEIYKIHHHLFEYADLIGKTDLEKIEIDSHEVVMTIKKLGIKMSIIKNDHRSQPLEIFNFDQYEKEELDLTLKLIKENFVVFDIGANIGWYSIIIGKLKKNAKVYAFEPIPQTFKFLKKNIKLNRLENVILFNLGLSDKSGKFTLYFSPERTGNASFQNLSGNKKTKKIACKVTTLDDFVKKRRTRCDFIKCDVEGAELLVFKGGIKTIDKFKPIILTEMLRKWSAKFNYHPNDIIKLLRSHGYKCFSIKEGKLKELRQMNLKTTETNFFFLHQETHAIEIKNLTEYVPSRN